MNFNAASFIVTEDCNLRCEYCFTKKAKKMMSEKVAKDAIDFLMKNIKQNNDKSLKIDLFGGEPTLAVPLLRTIIDYGFEQSKMANIQFIPKLITNATVFTEEYAEFLKEWKQKMGRVNIQLSIDGVPQIQDEIRIALNAEVKSSKLVEQAVKKYKELAKEINININEEIRVHSVTSKKSLPYLFDSYLYIKELGFSGLWNTLVQEEDWNEEDVNIYRRELTKLANYFVENKDQGLWREYTLFARNRDVAAQKPCGAGCDYCSISPEGDVYPCHRFYFADKKTRLGSIYDETFNEEQLMFYESITTDKLIGNKNCDKCANKNCYKCIAAFYETNKIPYLGFPKYCDMVDVETEIKQKFDKRMGFEKFNDSCNGSDSISNKHVEALLNNIAVPMAEAIDKTLQSNEIIVDEINKINQLLFDTNRALVSLSTLTAVILEKLSAEEVKNEKI